MKKTKTLSNKSKFVQLLKMNLEQTSTIKVLFLSAWYPSRINPMLGLFVEKHARAVAKKCQVAVLYVQPCEKTNPGNYKIEIINEKGFKQVIVYYNDSTKTPLISSLIKIYRWHKAYRKGFREIKIYFGDYDLIHVNILTRTGIIAYFKKMFAGKPYIISEHWSRYMPVNKTYKGFLRKWITKIVIRNASAVTTVTNRLKEAMNAHKLDHHHFRIVPNVVDTDLFTIGKKQNLGIKNIIHVSCFEDKSKNISGILRVLKKLSEKRNDFICRMVGDGIDKKMLEAYASDLGLLNKTVIFEGLKEGNELSAFYAEADFLLMFSNYETMAVVIAEGFSAGLPVVTTDVGGIPEFVSGTRGILVKPNDENALENAINTMLDNYANFNKTELRQYAIDHFSIDIIGNSFFEIYQQVLKK
jgi:glycosyltransferase involved in cell wall biosynthesis